MLTDAERAYVADLQASVDAAAMELLRERGKLAGVVFFQPDEPGAGWVLGYTVILHPEHPRGEFTVR